jgi:hypothetical protein
MSAASRGAIVSDCAALVPLAVRVLRVHLRMPSVSQGAQAGLWAIFFGLLIALGSISLDVDTPTAWIVGGLCAGAIFLFVRLRGADQVRPPR